MVSETITSSESYKILLSIFEKAFTIDGFEALCSLLRVGGMSSAHWDPFEESRNAFLDYNWLLRKSREERSIICSNRVSLLMYCHAVEMTAPHEIIMNLLRCICNKHYQVDPFKNLWCKKKNDYFTSYPPKTSSKFKMLNEQAKEAKQDCLIIKMNEFYNEKIRNAFYHSDYILTDDCFRYSEGRFAKEIGYVELDKYVSSCFEFYGAFIMLHRNCLLTMADGKKYYKWPNYEVLEILSSKEEGVYGFSVHFSNGSKATYSRRITGIEAINISFGNDDELVFNVGCIDDMESVWKINGKPVDNWDEIN